MTLAELRASLKLWEGRLVNRRAARDEAQARVDEAVAVVKRRKAQIIRAENEAALANPKIITAAQMGLTYTALFGSLGPEKYVTGHYTAGPLDRDDEHGIALAKSVHEYHRSKGWGGTGYHLMILRSGTILGLRPTRLMGAHVGGANTGNLGIVVNGTTGDTPTAAQTASLKWLLANAHTDAMPAAHRTDLDLRNAARRGHNDWSGHTSNGCPGSFKPMYIGTAARARGLDVEESVYPPTYIEGDVEINYRNVSPEEVASA